MSLKLISYVCHDCQANVSFESGIGCSYRKSDELVCRECFFGRDFDFNKDLEVCQISNVGFDTPNPCRSK